MDEKEILDLEFRDTYMIEPDEEEFFDTSEKILKLSGALAEDIILENIGEQLSSKIDLLDERINYVSIFKEKYSNIDPEDGYYDDEYLKEVLAKIATLIATGVKERYGVELGEDLEFVTPMQYFEDMETLYEFLFIRHSDNLIDYLKHKLLKNRLNFISSYKNLMNEETHSKDLFVIQSKKKFKNPDDVLIIHFLGEILRDIADMTTSAYDLFRDIVDIDLFEEYNNRMSELLVNYGNKVVINDDATAAKLYMSPLNDKSTFSEIRNAILMAYLEDCELEREENKQWN